MIERYADHSANERTFLAWVRTGIAVMAFGFLVEKFNLFLTYLVQAAGHPVVSPPGVVHAEVVGLLMLVAGVLVIVLGTARFAVNRTRIAQAEVFSIASSWPEIVLGIGLSGLGALLFVYLARLG
jgi:putative membrane protein